jgi:hypothetical protein
MRIAGSVPLTASLRPAGDDREDRMHSRRDQRRGENAESETQARMTLAPGYRGLQHVNFETHLRDVATLPVAHDRQPRAKVSVLTV